jgi:rod shape-determining protein MreD
MDGSGLWPRLESTLRQLAPLLLTLLLMGLLAVPLGLRNFGALSPLLALTAVFYWSVHAPARLGPVAVAILGLVQDILAGTPLGLHMALYLAVAFAARRQRQGLLAHSFWVLWGSFALVVAGVALLLWLLYSLAYQTMLPLTPALVQAGLTLALYPLLATLYGWLERLSGEAG